MLLREPPLTTCRPSKELNIEGADGRCLLKGHTDRKEKEQGGNYHFEWGLCTGHSQALWIFCEKGVGFSSLEMKKLPTVM